ncbi:D-alanine--D-alanine ligase [Brevibacterium sanguinis]|uniref:D-alanine--D-alanine ligase n=2 Tax=Brevibacterium TaxID=1696 RepID=A0A366INH7_9MICO|nr:MULTISPECIES: D-alanine--D-alanine ligase family protein [Brevibacterium]RBP67950.1 D-alanine--D-alanine ligase [Brevibacterium sanguinis]RBP74633.1 D-alanine--D-alanine ligase [Brevibacterium celere]
MPDTDPRPLVAVLFGGRSSEHSVSCVTAAGVIGAIDESAYRVLPIGITRTGVWRIVDDWADMRFDPANMPEVTENGTEVIPHVSATGAPLLQRDGSGTVTELDPVDVFFPLLHGQFGEDGTIQGLFELSGTAFVGSGVFASAASMDKHYTKSLLAQAGVPTCPWELVTAAMWDANRGDAEERVAGLGFPVFVKPARAGSSMGVSRVESAAGLEAALRSAFEHDTKVIVEPQVIGREIECAVLGSLHDAEVRTSLPGEIEVSGDHDFYDFEAKYLDLADAELTCPARIDEATTARIRELSAQVFQLFDCTGLSRVDTFVTGEGEVLINEINTLPGFTPTSAYPFMWAHSGLDYPQLISELIAIAQRDHARGR